MRLGNAISACAVCALAMVFSVQQGEHGPLVVYKLKMPAPAGSAAAAKPLPSLVMPAPQGTVLTPSPQAKKASPGAASPRLSPLEPTILGTVVMPAERALALTPPAAAETAAPVPLSVPDIQSVSRIAADYESGDEAMVNTETGRALTLQEVNEAVLWRRDTAEKLRSLPVGPRF